MESIHHTHSTVSVIIIIFISIIFLLTSVWHLEMYDIKQDKIIIGDCSTIEIIPINFYEDSKSYSFFDESDTVEQIKMT